MIDNLLFVTSADNANHKNSNLERHSPYGTNVSCWLYTSVTQGMRYMREKQMMEATSFIRYYFGPWFLI